MHASRAATGEQAYSSTEFMAICGARPIKDGEVVFAGTGIPLLSAMLAQKVHAPKSKIIYEGGFIDPKNIDLPLSVADSRLTYRAAAALGLIETLGMLLQGGRVDVGFLGAAQIDVYGNINTTYIGSFASPTVRLPGSGGANDIASSAKRTVIIMTHASNRLVDKLDYLTSPGALTGPGERERAGLKGKGPSLVVTDLCLFDFDEKTKKARLKALHPGVTLEKVKSSTGFELIVPGRVEQTEPPTQRELETLRSLDPKAIYLKK